MGRGKLMVILMTCVICTAARMVSTQPSEGRMPAQDVAAMEARIAVELSKEQGKGLVKAALGRDRSVLETTGPSIVSSFKQAGYSASEAESGLAWSWYLLRLGKGPVPVGKDLSPSVVQAKAIRLGRLIVNSQPDEATILVDGTRWPAGTNSEGFADIGRRRVRVEKAGMQAAEGTCDIARDRVATFVATLRTSGSTAECK